MLTQLFPYFFVIFTGLTELQNLKGVRQGKKMTKELIGYSLTLTVWRVHICNTSVLRFCLLVISDQPNIGMTRIMHLL